MQLSPWATDSIRIQIFPSSNPVADPPFMALIDDGPPPTRSGPAQSSSNGLSMDHGNLRINVDPTTFLVTAVRISDSATLLKQTALVFAAPNVDGTRNGSVSATVTFSGTSGEKIYGLGEHRTGVVNQMPYQKRFADSQDYSKSGGGDVSIPWYASSLGYGFVWNSPAYGYVDISESSIEWFSNATMGIDMWITTTSSDFNPASGVSPYSQLLSNYIDAVGHASTMPFYSTGFIQCKDRYRNQTQLLEVARGYVARGLPVSTIVIDWQHWKSQGDWQLNPTCWPDPQGMVDEINELGIELMITFWPFQTTSSINWDLYSSNGWLATDLQGKQQPYDGDQYLIDETNPVVRQNTFDKFWEGYGHLGIKTVWIDAAEPEHFGGPEGTWKFLAGTDAEIGEAWVQQHTKMLQDGFATKGIMPGDYFILPRSAWAGTWRHSAALWSGDIHSTFDELAIQIKVLQGVMMSGPSLWTTDIGGYFGGNPSDPVFQDLIVRWFQFGAFCPLFRLHGHRDGGPPSNECGPTNGDNEVWNLAEEPAHYAGITTVMKLREQLRQYVSTINAEAAATGMPMIRPMFLQYPLDPNCQTADVEDQFMFGSKWLVAPVYEYQATSRTVYLPEVSPQQEWVYFFNESNAGSSPYAQGGSRVTIPTTNITEFPLFFIRPITPTPPPSFYAATNLYSSSRGDSVLCVSDGCTNDNNPSNPGSYAPQRVEGLGLASSGDSNSVTINGTSYALVALNLFFSYNHTDNLVTTNSTPPDETYTVAGGGVTFENGYALADSSYPGSIPLQLFLKKSAGSQQDYLTVASASGVAWANSNGYTLISSSIGGWLIPQ